MLVPESLDLRRRRLMEQYTVRLYHVHHGTRKKGKQWGDAGLKLAKQVGDEVPFASQDEAEAFVRHRDLIDGWRGAQCHDKGHYIATITAPDGTVGQWENGEPVPTGRRNRPKTDSE
jgi:hypothetical protein